MNFQAMITYPNVKINLGLNVLRKRPDGYHDLETLFVPYFGLSDTLEIEPADKFSIDIFSETPGIPDWNPMSDLCAKAWRLMAERYGIPPVGIRLEKRNPVGAGLGGGSSDAAFTLRMLNGMFSLGLQTAELCALAAELGSDCPFFIHNRPMFGEGRGEILSGYDLGQIDCGNNPAAKWKLGVVALDGKLSVSTAKAYSSITPHVPALRLRDALRGSIDGWKDSVVNDFQKIVVEEHPLVGEVIRQCYEQGAVYAAMSGSGPSVFWIADRQLSIQSIR